MLQRIRDGLHGRKWVAWVALAPIALIFVFWGGTNTLDFSGAGGSDAAKVDGERIPAELATRAWTNVQAQWAQQLGAEIPAERQAQMKDGILEDLVRQKVIENRLAEKGFGVTETRVLTEFEKIPAFKGADGKYDPVTARQALQQANV